MLGTISARAFVAGVALAAAATFGSVGSAATVKDLNGKATCTYGATGAAVSSSVDCAKAKGQGPLGNTKLKQMNAQDIFTTKTWTIADKLGKKNQIGDFIEISFKAGKKSGTWKLADGMAFTAGEVYAIALKGAKKSFVYLLDTSATSGTWKMADIRNQSGKKAKLSKFTLFGTAALTQASQFSKLALAPVILDETEAPVPVPLPASGVLLMAALAGLGLMQRRRSQA